MTTTKYRDLTTVLVHAAWADASSWNKVILVLQGLGMRVRSAQIPLTSLTDDVGALKRLLRQVEGPALLAGHSYAGAVITAAATGDPHVKALVLHRGYGAGRRRDRWSPVSSSRPSPQRAPARSRC